MNELINKDSEWIIHFMGSLDRLLDNYERLTANYRPHWAESVSLQTRRYRHD